MDALPANTELAVCVAATKSGKLNGQKNGHHAARHAVGTRPNLIHHPRRQPIDAFVQQQVDGSNRGHDFLAGLPQGLANLAGDEARQRLLVLVQLLVEPVHCRRAIVDRSVPPNSVSNPGVVHRFVDR
jgi:hypothetical protein